MAGGRPTKYLDAYCDDVIRHMSDGLSLTAFAAEIGVARTTITEWMSVHPDFWHAVHVGKAKCAAWWERVGRNIALGGGGPGASTLAVFGIKNMAPEDWQDKSAVEHSGTVNLGAALDALGD